MTYITHKYWVYASLMERWTGFSYRKSGTARVTSADKQELGNAWEGTVGGLTVAVALPIAAIAIGDGDPRALTLILAGTLWWWSYSLRYSLRNVRDRRGEVELYQFIPEVEEIDKLAAPIAEEQVDDEEEHAAENAKGDFPPTIRRLPWTGVIVGGEVSSSHTYDIAPIPADRPERLTDEELSELKERRRAAARFPWAYFPALLIAAGLFLGWLSHFVGWVLGFGVLGVTLWIANQYWREARRKLRQIDGIFRDPRLRREGWSWVTESGMVWSHGTIPSGWRRGRFNEGELPIPMPSGDGI